MFEPRPQVEHEAPGSVASRLLPPAAASRLKRDRAEIEDALRATLASEATRVAVAAPMPEPAPVMSVTLLVYLLLICIGSAVRV